MDIVIVRIYKSKAMYIGRDVTDIYGNKWEFQPDVKNRQIKARPSAKTGRAIATGGTIGIASIIDKIGINYLFNDRTAVTQVMTLGNDGWFTTNIDHTGTKARSKIDVKTNAVNNCPIAIADKSKRRQVRPDGIISLYIKSGRIRLQAELCGKVDQIYVRTIMSDHRCVVMLSTTNISTDYRKRMVTASGVICLHDIKYLRDHFSDPLIHVKTDYDRGVYTVVINLGDKIDTGVADQGVSIEHQPVSEVEKMTFWQRVKFVFGW